MRLLRSTVAVATLATLAFAVQLAACGGDDADEAGPPSPDGSSPPQPETDASAPVTGPTLTVSTSRAKLYLGQSAKIDGATIAPEIASKLVWTVVAAPSASAITTASIQDATTASPSLKPDRLGLYTLQLSGAKADGAVASVLVIIEAIDVPVFLRDLHVTGEATGATALTTALSTQVAGAYGTEAQSVGCPTTIVTDGGLGESEVAGLFASARTSATNGDAWEAPPGTPSRVVFSEFQMSGVGGGTVTSRLAVATSSSACGAAEAKVLETISSDAGTPGITSTSFIYNARFAPDGNRIAYMNDVNGGARLSTIGFDGADKRDLSPVIANGDGGLEPEAGTPTIPAGVFALGPVSPRWKDATHVGWVSFVGPTAMTADRSDWELWVVEDKAGATAELAMRCTGSGLKYFDFLPDGTIVASARHVVSTDAGDVAPMDLLVYRANATTKACEVVRNLTNYTTTQSIARDLALSPDKSTVAFFGGIGVGVPTTNPTDNITVLSTVPVDGSRAAAPVPGVSGPADFGVGPRWGGGGTVITWGQVELSAVGGGEGAGSPLSVGRLMSVPASGGDTILVAAGTAGAIATPDGGLSVDYHLRYGMGQGCSATPGAVSNGVMFVFGMLGVGTLLARRRRSGPTQH